MLGFSFGLDLDLPAFDLGPDLDLLAFHQGLDSGLQDKDLLVTCKIMTWSHFCIPVSILVNICIQVMSGECLCSTAHNDVIDCRT